MTSENDVQFEYDKSVVGVEFELGSLEVTAEIVANYCKALSETNPLYTDEAAAKAGPYGGIIAPPGLMSALNFGRGGQDAKVKFGNTSFFAGSRLEVYAPIHSGDTITAKTSVKGVYPKTGRSGTMVFEVRRTDYVNEDGVTVAATESSQVYREV
ncbi:MAG TPA: MaoC family dehydratase N-terminal domain-containing protein [Dehalococcoidia bacterium]|jgi:acyl dehydratase|nr:MaoC family dehydratase N-terminal domain-containing protein [Dehalococcoidia bacterium]